MFIGERKPQWLFGLVIQPFPTLYTNHFNLSTVKIFALF